MQMSNEHIVITYGTFDLFHIGHLRLLERMKQMGTKLYVGVSTDEFNEIKGKKTLIPYEQRAEIVESIKYVDKVFPETSWDQKINDIQKYRADLFVIGDDWKDKFDFLKEYCDVAYLARTEGISTTEIKKTLKLFSVSREEILKAFDVLERLANDFE
jgi:glycerol-3-phosphate cytidylyltransferase